MRTNSYLFLILLAAALITPMMVNLCHEKADISIALLLGEEENSDTSIEDSENLTQHPLSVSIREILSLKKEIPTMGYPSFWDGWYPDNIAPPPEI